MKLTKKQRRACDKLARAFGYTPLSDVAEKWERAPGAAEYSKDGNDYGDALALLQSIAAEIAEKGQT